jgi:hypothetical protein
MLGALAWQATTVIKMILVSWGEIARGLFILAPGSPPVCLVSSSWHKSTAANRSIFLAQIYRRESIMDQPSKTKGTIANLQLKYNPLSAIVYVV